MGIIRTVTGDISPSDLGICLPHEHLFGIPPAPYHDEDKDLVLDNIDLSLQEAVELQKSGVQSLVEMTPIDYHRNPIGLHRISQNSGLQIICATGYLKEKFCGPIIDQMSIDDIAQQMILDIQIGIDDTEVRAGVIKASSSLNAISVNEEKVFQAAAIAQQETGALISTHTEKGTMALEQINILTQAGVEPNRILIGHLDRLLDWDTHIKAAEYGVYLGYDQISKDKYYPDGQRLEFIKGMIKLGYQSQLMLSMDLARRSDFRAYGGQTGHTYFMHTFVPMLYSAGLAQDVIDTIIKENPRVALSIVS